MDPVLWFVTPVWRRFHLTKVCLEQRKRMIERLPFAAQCVVIGDDENLEVAEGLGFPVVEMGNAFVGAKFNAGYRHAVGEGATHCMPIGSDSWLHENVFAGEELEDRKALGIVGLSSFSPDGQERVDLSIKYPAGFGVGMVYPAHAVAATKLRGEASDPTRNKGIDNSTWARVGRGQVQIRFMDPKRYTYINFHSTDESITDFRMLKNGKGRVREYDDVHPFDVLKDLYDADLIEDLKSVYALRALEVFLTGKRPEFTPRFGPRRRYPNLAKRGTTSESTGGNPSRYPNISGRPRPQGVMQGTPSDYAQIADRKRRKEQGKALTREEEISIRFDAARGF